MSKEQADKKKAPPFKFLLESSAGALGQFQLAKQDEAAALRSGRRARLRNLRSALLSLFEQFDEELRNQEAMFDRLVDVSAQALLATWLRTIDRQELVRQLLESSTVTLDGILDEAKAQIRNSGRSAEELEAGRMPMRIFPPGVAHRNASKRYQAANIAEGKCEKCPEPQDPSSNRYCPYHLAIEREKDRQKNYKAGKRGNPNLEPGTRAWLYGSGEVEQSTHGRQPGTLASLEMNREKKTRAVLAELGIPPESAAVSLKAAKEALLRVMPDSKAKALPAYDLFQAAQIPTGAGRRSTTDYKALRELLKAGKIQRIGEGKPGSPFRYFALKGASDPRGPGR